MSHRERIIAGVCVVSSGLAIGMCARPPHFARLRIARRRSARAAHARAPFRRGGSPCVGCAHRFTLNKWEVERRLEQLSPQDKADWYAGTYRKPDA